MIGHEHFQIAYVTRNLQKAVDRFIGAGLVENFMQLDMTFQATTRSGSGMAHLKMALGFGSKVMYELIEPVSGPVDLYTDALPDSEDDVQFHHIAYLVDEWEPLRSKLAAEGAPIALEGGDENRRFLYVDTRPLLGHYLEYVWMPPEGLARLRSR